LTELNNDVHDPSHNSSEDDIEPEKWKEGKHKGKDPKTEKPHPKPFQFEIEYDTFTDKIYKLKDLTVRSYIKLAHRIGQYKPEKGDGIDEADDDEEYGEDDENDDYDEESNELEIANKHKKKKHHRQHEKNKVWLRFVSRAFVGTLEQEELRNFEAVADSEEPKNSWQSQDKEL